MKNILFLLLLPLLALQPQLASANFEKTKIAVLDFDLQGSEFQTEDIGSIVAEWFTTALVKEGRFEVVERTFLKKIIAEQKLSNSGLIGEDSATKIGKVLGVKVVITGSVIKIGDINEINARIIDVESASVIAAENVQGNRDQKLHELVSQMAAKIIKNFPLEGYIVNVNGKTVTIDLGLLAGVKSGMDFIVYKEGNIIKHPTTGEILDVELIETGRVEITSVQKKIAVGKISSEKSNSSIQYGQLVKSLAAPLQPPNKKSHPQQKAYLSSHKKIAQNFRQISSTSRKLPPELRDFATQLQSNNIRKIKIAAKRILRAGISNPDLLDIAEKQLLDGYATTERHKIDAMAWLCKILGNSGNPKYKTTLQKVANEGGHRKLKKYANKALSMLE